MNILITGLRQICRRKDMNTLSEQLNVQENWQNVLEKSPEKAYFTGLIHDCAKCLPKDETLHIIRNFLNLEEDELCSPKTHHAPVGAYIAKKEFKIDDEEILSAIRWHTIGNGLI